MRERIITNWKTTVIGVPILLYGLFMIVCVIYHAITKCCPECAYKPMEIITTMGLGWAFITARDTLIEGMLGNVIKVK